MADQKNINPTRRNNDGPRIRVFDPDEVERRKPISDEMKKFIRERVLPQDRERYERLGI